ncbi:unnamed protein product [Triticum turgidum subsp. durum]|uniref:Signal recognition particle receptor subunit beta n=1 Tax=Triticum turgidum subsp. durum TaxID=4567 RepID=A0A9R0ZCU3_TRITD|nr:unnamed protein product [Triticum turgidum subsp. durum]
MDEWVRQAEAWAGQAERWIRQQPPEQIYVAVTVIAVTILVLLAGDFQLMTSVYLIFLTASCLKSSKSNTIVLSGLSGSGKTILFYQKGKVKPVHVVDVPGHARLKPKLDEFLPRAAGVVFVVDAQDFLSSMQAAAEYLYDILTKATVVKKRVPVLIFCNKTDKVTAHSKEFIKKQLEKEVNKLRESRNAISSADITDEVELGVPGEAFNFSQCQNKVTVAEGAGLTGNVSAVEQFIREHVRA